MQETFQISIFGAIPVEFGSMDKKTGFYDKHEVLGNMH